MSLFNKKSKYEKSKEDLNKAINKSIMAGKYDKVQAEIEHIKLMREHAECGDPNAELEFGLYLLSTGKEEYRNKAKEFIEDSAEQGNAKAQYEMYRCGNIWGIDGLDWLKESAENGYDRAMYNLGCHYSYYGKDEEDFENALKWLSKVPREFVNYWSVEEHIKEAEDKLFQLRRDDVLNDL